MKKDRKKVLATRWDINLAIHFEEGGGRIFFSLIGIDWKLGSSSSFCYSFIFLLKILLFFSLLQNMLLSASSFSPQKVFKVKKNKSTIVILFKREISPRWMRRQRKVLWKYRRFTWQSDDYIGRVKLAGNMPLSVDPSLVPISQPSS